MSESIGLELEPELRYCGATVPDACEDEFLMPNALLSAGLVHILHNLTMEVDAALPWWPDWLEGFRCLTHFVVAQKPLETEVLGSMLARNQARKVRFSFFVEKWCPFCGKVEVGNSQQCPG